MATETKLIRYNLRDRGRTLTGQARNFDIRAICDAVNSPECQERVAARDMVGYLGHWPRVRFGLDATEGGIAEGKAHAVEPAIVTTHLRASYDGTVEHRTEFLDTPPGQIAERMFENRVGGFSSAIDEARPRFVAFDYVANPNYTNNSFRGVVLDDALSGPSGPLTYDQVLAAERDEQAQTYIMLLDSLRLAREQAAWAIDRLQAENEQLLSALSARGIDKSAVLDAVPRLPVAVPVDPADRMARDVAAFRAVAHLPVVVPPRDAPTDDDRAYAALLARFC